MSILEEIKILLKLKSAEEVIVKEASTMDGTKPGWKTTEFWLTVANQVAIVWGSTSGLVPPKYAVIVSAVGTAVYTILRTLAKS